jgi:hypothetical protein
MVEGYHARNLWLRRYVGSITIDVTSVPPGGSQVQKEFSPPPQRLVHQEAPKSRQIHSSTNSAKVTTARRRASRSLSPRYRRVVLEHLAAQDVDLVNVSRDEQLAMEVLVVISQHQQKLEEDFCLESRV